MKSYLYHLQVNIDFSNLAFYQELMSFLGWTIIFESSDVIGYTSGTNGDIWFLPASVEEKGNYDATGVNHISLRVEQMEDIDKIAEFLKSHTIQSLFQTPRHRPEFVSKTEETYYQIMFTSPDNILFEIVYIGPHSKK